MRSKLRAGEDGDGDYDLARPDQMDDPAQPSRTIVVLSFRRASDKPDVHEKTPDLNVGVTQHHRRFGAARLACSSKSGDGYGLAHWPSSESTNSSGRQLRRGR